MRSLHKVMAISSCLATLLGSQPGHAASDPLITPHQAEAIYRHLVELHWTPQTGLFRSFPDSTDLKLSQQASTYEQGAMGLLAIRFGDRVRAEQLLGFFQSEWKNGPEIAGPRAGLRGFANFYNADFGSEGIEKTIHAGPNAWIGLFAAKYANTFRDKDALQLALDVQYWMENALPHDQGGIAMGLRNDPFGAAWSKVYSTENNLSYYALLTELLRSPKIDKRQRVTMTTERDRVENWLVKHAYDADRGFMLRGFNPSGRDETQALDTVTWLISAVGPRRLAERSVDPYRLMDHAEKEFEVTVAGRQGVDAAGIEEAKLVFQDLRHQVHEINRPASDGHRVIWYEGLGQYILALGTMADYSQNIGLQDKARAFRLKAEDLTREFDATALSRFDRQSAFTYATPGKFFRYGWGAPKEAEDGPASSLISGVWRAFAGLGVDPLSGRRVSGTPDVAVTLPTDIVLAKRKEAILYGTSEDMTREAWRALGDGRLDQAIRQASATIEEWASAAQYLQKRKEAEVGGLVEYSGRAEERTKVFKYWALNDVAASYFILGQALDKKSDYKQAALAFSQIVNHYSLAQIWDPQGWFWSPLQAVTDDYVLPDRKRYGNVLPQVFAEGSRTGKLPF